MFVLPSFLSIKIVFNINALNITDIMVEMIKKLYHICLTTYNIIWRTTVVVSLRLRLHLTLGSWLVNYIFVLANILKYLFTLLFFLLPSVDVIIGLLILESSQKSLIFHGDLEKFSFSCLSVETFLLQA